MVQTLIDCWLKNGFGQFGLTDNGTFDGCDRDVKESMLIGPGLIIMDIAWRIAAIVKFVF